MEKRMTTDLLFDSLKEIGIKTSLPEGFRPERNLISRSLAEVELARRDAEEWIQRIFDNAKRHG